MVQERNQTQTKGMVVEQKSKKSVKYSRDKTNRIQWLSTKQWERRRVKNDSEWPGLESFMDADAINMGGETERGLGVEVSVDNY